MNSRELIAARVAQELKAGTVVNLGIGLPTLVTKYLPEGIILQSENGMLNMGPPAPEGQADPYICDAGGKILTLQLVMEEGDDSALSVPEDGF
jgi:acetate CoA/acetoacetate CoA-transferase beta subunit